MERSWRSWKARRPWCDVTLRCPLKISRDSSAVPNILSNTLFTQPVTYAADYGNLHTTLSDGLKARHQLLGASWCLACRLARSTFMGEKTNSSLCLQTEGSYGPAETSRRSSRAVPRSQKPSEGLTDLVKRDFGVIRHIKDSSVQTH